MNELTELEQQIKQTKATLEQLQARAEELRSKIRKQVVYVKRGNTVTLKYNGREIKARRNRYRRWDVSEKGKVIIRDYPWGINELRLAFALTTV